MWSSIQDRPKFLLLRSHSHPCEEGKNPFFVEKKDDEEGKKGDFDRILELCVKET